MPKQPLTLDAIELGALVKTTNDILAEIAQDVVDRPYLAGKRTLTLKIVIQPKLEKSETRVVNMPLIDWTVAKSVPGAKGMQTRAYVDNEGKGLVYNTGQPLGGHPDQITIEDITPHQEQRRSS